MSYLVLARKYRSRNFQSLVGQAPVVQALSNALKLKRLHHAYLFTGTRGVGKTSVSRILAKALNCSGADGQGDITAQPCGICTACCEIDEGRFIDYVELDAASHRGVEEISQLLDQAAYRPVMGRFKVYMIDEVHMLSNTAFNAMLKTLEEPPEYLKFVLATTDPQKVPPTVLSRCLQFNLRPMPAPTIEAHLADILAQEQLSVPPAALRLLALAAKGSMRDALSLTDQAIAYGAGPFTEAQVRDMLGSVDHSYATRLVQALIDNQGAQVIATVDELRSLGLSAGATLEEIASLLHHMAVAQAVPTALDPDDPQSPATAQLASLLPADETQLFYSIALHGRAELDLAPDEYSGLVMVLLRLLAFRPTGTAKPAADSPAPSIGAMTPSTPAAPKAASTDAAQAWFTLVQNLCDDQKITALVRELALQSQCTAIDETTWHLRVAQATLGHANQRDKLQAAMAEHLGEAVQLTVYIGPTHDTPAQRLAAQRAQKQRFAQETIENDPVTRALMQQFKTAHIVPGSVQIH